MTAGTRNSHQNVATGASGQGLNELYLRGVALFFTMAVYAASLQFKFTYDDQGQIVENALVHSWRFVPDYFRGNQWQDSFHTGATNYYRPLDFLWLRINDAVFGLHPAGWHATAILLHLLATFLVYSVARRLTGRPLVAGLTALFFGVHPMTHEVVAWISGTTESLWAIFFLSAFLTYLKFDEVRQSRWLFASCGLYAAGLLAKETAIVFPVLVFAHACIYGNRTTGNHTDPLKDRILDAAKAAGYYVPIAIVYLAVRVSVLNGFSHPQQLVTPAAFVLTLPSIAFFYFKQWLFPVQLSEFYDLPVSTSFNVSHVLLPVCGLLLIAVALFLVRRKFGSREVAFATAWMILPLLPAFDFVVFPLGDLVHDRYFYVSSFGAALLLALGLEKLAKGPVAFGIAPRRLLFTTLALLLVLSWDTANAASYWSDNYVLFQHAYQLAPQNANPRLNYAIELSERGQYDKALPILEQLLKDQPDNYLANYNLGRALYELGLLNAAEHYFQQTVKLSPGMSRAYLHLGLIDMKTQREDEAVRNMRQAVALRPLEPSLHFALAVALAQQSDCKTARAEFLQTLGLEPGFPHAEEQMEKCGAGSTGAKGGSQGTGAGVPSLAGVAAAASQ